MSYIIFTDFDMIPFKVISYNISVVTNSGSEYSNIIFPNYEINIDIELPKNKKSVEELLRFLLNNIGSAKAIVWDTENPQLEINLDSLIKLDNNSSILSLTYANIMEKPYFSDEVRQPTGAFDKLKNMANIYDAESMSKVMERAYSIPYPEEYVKFNPIDVKICHEFYKQNKEKEKEKDMIVLKNGLKSPKELKQIVINEKEGIVTVVAENLNPTLHGDKKSVTLAKTAEGDEFDKYVGAALAIAYQLFGSRTQFRKYVDEQAKSLKEIKEKKAEAKEKAEKKKSEKVNKKATKEGIRKAKVDALIEALGAELSKRFETKDIEKKKDNYYE